MKKSYFSAIVILLITLAFSELTAQPQKNEKEDAKVFVQKFYDWYVALVNTPVKKKKGESCNCDDVAALTQKSIDFDVHLRKAIIDDAKAQAKANEIVGLDSDPFLAAQDIGFGYQAGTVKQVGQKFYVDIHYAEISKSKKQILAGPVAVVAEVTKTNGRWIFTNFIYPVDGRRDDLLTILKNLATDRKTPAKK